MNFTYTGNYNVRNDGVVELLSSGTITFKGSPTIDIFLVGGGGGARGGWSLRDYCGGGGGGGYTATYKNVGVGGSVAVTIGTGGTTNTSTANDSRDIIADSGGTTIFGNYSVSGGGGAGGSESGVYTSQGGAGGSGGGGGSVPDYRTGGSGGVDGSNGVDTSTYGGRRTNGGRGQGTTTREFGESSGKLYSTGGAGGSIESTLERTPSVDNSGNGGNAYYSYNNRSGATNGNSGIVCIRLSK